MLLEPVNRNDFLAPDKVRREDSACVDSIMYPSHYQQLVWEEEKKG